MAVDPKAEIEAALQKALEKEAPEYAKIPFYSLERPRQAGHGDYSTSVALQLAKRLNRNPRELAQRISTSTLALTPAISTLIEQPKIDGPGFINFRLKQGTKTDAIRQALEAGQSYGRARKDQPTSVQVEFVSANPTGPLHVGHGRQAALGDALAALIEAQGDKVTREFYYNDAGAQIQNLALSVQARKRGIKPGEPGWPKDGYAGEYIQEIADAFPGPDELDAIRAFAVAYLRNEQDIDLREFGVKFDVYYLESSLYADGKVEAVV
jgi:arginyl-tRNA synthetase